MAEWKLGEEARDSRGLVWSLLRRCEDKGWEGEVGCWKEEDDRKVTLCFHLQWAGVTPALQR